MNQLGRALCSVLLVLAALAGGLVHPGAAKADAAAMTSYVVMDGSADYVTNDRSLLFATGDGDSVVSAGDADNVEVTVNGKSGDSFALSFSAPAGQPLAVGSYTGVQRPVSGGSAAPSIDINGEGRACDTASGAFTVRDVATTDGVITRLLLDYLQYCDDEISSISGEIAINEPEPAALIAPQIAAFPRTYPRAKSTVIPVYVLAPADGTVTVLSAQLSGDDAGQFAIRADACSGETVLPGRPCVVSLRFQPTAAGPDDATLHITTRGGSADVPVTGFGSAGTTSFGYTSDPGDYIGGGGSGTYTPAADVFTVSGTTTGVHLRLHGADNRTWTLDAAPASGDTLSAGKTYDPAPGYRSDPDSAGLTVSGGGGCNTSSGSFTVNSVSVDPAGNLVDIDLSFEQHCEEATPALRGEFRYSMLAAGQLRDDPANPYPTSNTPTDARVHPSPSAPITVPPDPPMTPPPASAAGGSTGTPAAGASRATFVTMVGHGDFVSGGQTLLFDPLDGASVGVSGNASEVDVRVSDQHNSFDLDLAPPAGTDVHRCFLYPGAAHGVPQQGVTGHRHLGRRARLRHRLWRFHRARYRGHRRSGDPAARRLSPALRGRAPHRRDRDRRTGGRHRHSPPGGRVSENISRRDFDASGVCHRTDRRQRAGQRRNTGRRRPRPVRDRLRCVQRHDCHRGLAMCRLCDIPTHDGRARGCDPTDLDLDRTARRSGHRLRLARSDRVLLHQ